jgi:hypothetical protein
MKFPSISSGPSPQPRRRSAWRFCAALACMVVAAGSGGARAHAAGPLSADARQATGNRAGAQPANAPVASAATLPMKVELHPSLMRAEDGHAWIISLPKAWEAYSSNLTHLDRSRARLTEDGKPLGPNNATHDEIRTDGNGAYSHWQTALYFSTSDNSDPRSNGRVYVVELPAADD